VVTLSRFVSHTTVHNGGPCYDHGISLRSPRNCISLQNEVNLPHKGIVLFAVSYSGFALKIRVGRVLPTLALISSFDLRQGTLRLERGIFMIITLGARSRRSKEWDYASARKVCLSRLLGLYI
jgi:hypothetical protein